MYELLIPSNVQELDHEELVEVNGGVWGWGVLLAAATFVYDVFQDLGRELYYLTKKEDK